jgi:predicted kinase
MNRLDANDLRDLVKEVVSSYWNRKRSKWLLESPKVIEEGVFDPGILKAIFTAGGPGSGKSFVADMLMGARSLEKPYQKYFEKNTSYLPAGIKYVNSDNLFEKGLRKMGINPKDLADIESLPGDELWDIIQGKDPESIRNIAKDQLAVQRAFYESGRLGVLVDGTGREYEKIARQKEKMEKLGYDTAMVFVNTSEEVAQQRNAGRDRVLPEKTITDLWNAVQNNLKAYAQLFGNDFTIVMNDAPGAPPESAIKSINDFVRAPVENPIGQAWIEGELERRGVQTLEPGGAGGFRGDRESAERIARMRQMRDEQGEE